MNKHHATDEIYEPDPNTVDVCFCGVCDDNMEVEHNIKPSGGFAGAMAGHNRYYDKFQCPHRKEAWHRQAGALRREIKKTASKRLVDWLTEELDEILTNRQPTQEGWD